MITLSKNHTGLTAPALVPPNVKALESEQIAADIAAFKKKGGKIEVLGNTPLRPLTVSQNRKTRQHRKKADPALEPKP